MKEFVEKLIGRLEELYDSNNKVQKKAYEEQDLENFELFMYGNEGVKESIEIVNQLAEEMGVFKMENTTWIACKDQLPTKYDDYICLNKSGEIALGFPIKKESEDGFYSERKTKNGIEGLDDVIYWQPLPDKLYKKEIDLEIEYE